MVVKSMEKDGMVFILCIKKIGQSVSVLLISGNMELTDGQMDI